MTIGTTLERNHRGYEPSRNATQQETLSVVPGALGCCTAGIDTRCHQIGKSVCDKQDSKVYFVCSCRHLVGAPDPATFDSTAKRMLPNDRSAKHLNLFHILQCRWSIMSLGRATCAKSALSIRSI